VLQCVAVCCSVLQCVAVRCSVLQCVAVCLNMLQCVEVCCSVLKYVAVSKAPVDKGKKPQDRTHKISELRCQKNIRITNKISESQNGSQNQNKTTQNKTKQNQKQIRARSLKHHISETSYIQVSLHSHRSLFICISLFPWV